MVFFQSNRQYKTVIQLRLDVIIVRLVLRLAVTLYAPQGITSENHAFREWYLEKSEGSKRGETRSEHAIACGLRLSGASRYIIIMCGVPSK